MARFRTLVVVEFANSDKLFVTIPGWNPHTSVWIDTPRGFPLLRVKFWAWWNRLRGFDTYCIYRCFARVELEAEAPELLDPTNWEFPHV